MKSIAPQLLRSTGTTAHDSARCRCGLVAAASIDGIGPPDTAGPERREDSGGFAMRRLLDRGEAAVCGAPISDGSALVTLC